MPLFGNKPLMKINASWFMAMAAFVAADSAIVMFLNDAFGYEEREVAYYFLLVGVVIILTQGGLVGRLSKRHGEWSLCILGLVLNGFGACGTALTEWYRSPWLLAGSAVVYAFGRSLFQPTISALVSHHSDVDQQGLSFGFFQAVGTLARIVGPLGAVGTCGGCWRGRSGRPSWPCWPSSSPSPTPRAPSFAALTTVRPSPQPRSSTRMPGRSSITPASHSAGVLSVTALCAISSQRGAENAGKFAPNRNQLPGISRNTLAVRN